MNICYFPQDTYANWSVRLTAGTLPAGKWIRITDRADLGTDLFCTSTNQFSLQGDGGFLNADFQNVGDYSGVPGFVTNLGIWNGTLAPVIGDVVIWNCRHWLNLTGVVGTAPDGDPTNWALLPKTAANVGYIEEWDVTEYDFAGDWLQMRGDK